MKTFLVALALLIPLAAVPEKPFFALAWGLDDFNRDKPCRVSPYSNITMFYYLEESRLTNVALAKEKLNEQPAGRRTIFDWNVNRRMYQHPGDKQVGPSGDRFTGFWWDHGLVDAEQAYDTFFSRYKEMGGKLDFFITDLEHPPGSDLKKIEHWETVAKDPRFEQVLKAVHAQDVASLRRERSVEWFRMIRYGNYLMAERLNRLHAVVRKYFPQVKSSDYSGYYDQFNLPYAWAPAPDLGDFLGARGGHTGTHQSRNLYGVLTYLGVKEFEGRPFGQGPFRSLVYAVNEMRSSVLSSPVPIMPWVAWRGYRSDYENRTNPPPVSSFGRTDLYQESIFHGALCNPENFLFWSAFRWKETQSPADWCSQSDLALLDKMLSQINGLVGYADRKTVVSELTGWYDPFILTGMSANGKSIWRFTPDGEAGKDARETLVPGENLTFRVKGTTVEIPGGKIEVPSGPPSPAGVWVVAPLGAKPKIIRGPTGQK